MSQTELPTAERAGPAERSDLGVRTPPPGRLRLKPATALTSILLSLLPLLLTLTLATSGCTTTTRRLNPANGANQRGESKGTGFIDLPLLSYASGGRPCQRVRRR
jgi:hypothetical protein